MNDIDKWASSLIQAYKEELEEAIIVEQKEDLLKYGRILENAILQTWDNYMNSYTPIMYQRTGRTRKGIVLDKNITVSANNRLQIAVQFIDSYVEDRESITGEDRNKFLAIDQGWFINGSVENYGFASGHDLIGTIRNTIQSLLPSYIEFEFIETGNLI